MLQREDLDFKRRRGDGPCSLGEPAGGGDADKADALDEGGAMSVAEVGPPTVACMGTGPEWLKEMGGSGRDG